VQPTPQAAEPVVSDPNETWHPDDAFWGKLSGFGMACSSRSWNVAIQSEEQLSKVFESVSKAGGCINLRGSGASYGDANINTNQIVVDCTPMNEIESWDPETGLIRVQAGVTVEQVWRHVIADGYWPPVVSGTMTPTIAGALAMNIHGKNCYAAGTLGEHVVTLRVLVPSGDVIECGPDKNGDFFRAVIGSYGMLGCILSATLRLKPIQTGQVEVTAYRTPNLAQMFDVFAKNVEQPYLVGWIDAFAKGDGAGRGIVHVARHLRADEVSNAAATLQPSAQELPGRLFGILPKSWMWRLLKPFSNRAGMRLINAVKYRSCSGRAEGKTHRESLGAFNFLLDFVPNWRFVYRPGGFIQHQSFVPADHAQEVFTQTLALARQYGMPPYLAVFKRHRTDAFLLSHGVDGYSLALDFAINNRSRGRIIDLTSEIDQLVVSAGGRFYPAKDATLHAEDYRRSLPDHSYTSFKTLKAQTDPHNILQSDLYRRLFQGGPMNPGILQDG